MISMAGFEYDDLAIMEDMREDGMLTSGQGHHSGRKMGRSPFSKTRSLSDGGGIQLSPSPLLLETSRRTSKDDSSLKDHPRAAPVTPRRSDFAMRGLSLQVPKRESTPPTSQTTPYTKPVPPSPKLEPSQIYASPTNMLPRRSRGLDFSRAATSLHHSMLAEQSSPESSPTIGGRAMNIPGRKASDGVEQSTNSLWSMMGSQERINISSSIGSTQNMPIFDSSSSSDEDDIMDEDMEDAILGTPQTAKTGMTGGRTPQGLSASSSVMPWLLPNSPSMSGLSSFRSRQRKMPKKKLRGPLGLGGFNPAGPVGLSKSPPAHMAKESKEGSHSRRESISWAANQLHISGSEADDRAIESVEGGTPSKDGQRGVVRRAVTRRGNLLPKTKGFARIRAALAEESAPVDSEFRREAEVIRQVRDSDLDLEPRVPSLGSALDPNATSHSSPNMTNDQLDDVTEEDLMGDSILSESFKQKALRNSKGIKQFWDTFSETSSIAGGRTTPPPPAFLPRGSSSGISEDINMDSPALSAGSGNNSLFGSGPSLTAPGQNGDAQRSDTPQPTASTASQQQGKLPPTAEEITRRINNKRRRDDDFDPASFKRRAVSPGMSVHNSPVMQSPLQRDVAPWGSRPGSNHGLEKASATPSDNGSTGGNSAAATNGGARPVNGTKGRVGFQGMVDTNDGLMRMSIE